MRKALLVVKLALPSALGWHRHFPPVAGAFLNTPMEGPFASEDSFYCRKVLLLTQYELSCQC